MPDERPRPQYGEYAPEGWVSPHYQPPEPPVEATPVPAPAVPGRTWDRVLTFALLAFGLYTVISSFIAFTQLPATLDAVFAQLGVGDFTSDAAANAVGLAANIIQPIIWVIVAWLSWRSLQTGRVTFWIPLAGGVLANLIVGILVGVVMAGDPAYLEYYTQMLK